MSFGRLDRQLLAQELGTEEAKEMRFLVSQPPGKRDEKFGFNPSQLSEGHVFFLIGDWNGLEIYEKNWYDKGRFLGGFISQLGGHVFFFYRGICSFCVLCLGIER